MAKKSFKLKQRTDFKFKVGDKVIFNLTGEDYDDMWTGTIVELEYNPKLKPYVIKSGNNIYYANEQFLKLAK